MGGKRGGRGKAERCETDGSENGRRPDSEEEREVQRGEARRSAREEKKGDDTEIIPKNPFRGTNKGHAGGSGLVKRETFREQKNRNGRLPYPAGKALTTLKGPASPREAGEGGI